LEFLSLCWRVFWLWYNEPRHARRIRELRASIDRLERELFPEWFSLGGAPYPFKIELRPGRVLTVGDRATEVRVRDMWQRFQARHRPPQNYTQVFGSHNAAYASSAASSLSVLEILHARNVRSLSQQLAARGMLRSSEVARQKAAIEEALFFGPAA
jgi:hypothetical protein